jgi:hypothetical protein
MWRSVVLSHALLQALLNQLRDEVDSLQMQLTKANNHSRETLDQLSQHKSELASTLSLLQQTQKSNAGLVEAAKVMKERFAVFVVVLPVVPHPGSPCA